MAANINFDSALNASQSREVFFAGDSVFLAGQIDYPDAPAPVEGYPLLVIFHHAGGHTRSDYNAYAAAALEVGFAVFRWDKRGAGRSGGGARGSTLNDSINAYKIALAQPGINRHSAVIMALADGTLMLHDVFELLCAVQKPRGALLLGNMLDRQQILALKIPLQVLMGDNDWISWQVYGREASAAHANAYAYGTRFDVVHFADRLLIDLRMPDGLLHAAAKQVIKDWLGYIVKL